MNEAYNDKLNQASRRMIASDCATIMSLSIYIKDDPIYCLCFYPFVALFCRATQEYYSRTLFDSNTDQMVCDIRNGLKFTTDRFNHVINIFSSENELHDNYFKSILRFGFLRKMGLYTNLGVYLNEDGQIISNTQLAGYYYNLSMPSRFQNSRRAYEVGLGLGRSIGVIRINHPYSQPVVFNRDLIKHGYQDFNTQNKNNLFLNSENINLNLFLLHLLSIANSYYILFEPLMKDDNSWKLRFEYIICHMVWSGLNNIKNHYLFDKQPEYLKFDELRKLCDEGAHFFPSNYRNAMYHYGLISKGAPSIIETYYTEEDPLFGLVQSCFKGKTTEDYYRELRNYMADIRNYLEGFFIIDPNKTKYD